MTGPKMRPTFSVPRDWMRKSATRIATAAGTMNGWAAVVAMPIPSTAEITEIAGVITPSPKSIAAPATTTIVNHPRRSGTPNDFGGDASARSARIPPSPS